MANLPECPPSLKSIQHYLKAASEHDNRDPVVAYWCRLHALQVGLKLSTKKTPEESKLLIAIMNWLEETKKLHLDNETISNEVAAQAHLENYALKLFLFADKQDREMSYGKNVVKAFYTAGLIYDVLTTFGELTDEATQNRKYAKWKAAYIHNCLKNGETPVPGPMQSEEGDISNEESTVSPTQPGPTNTDFNIPQVAGFSSPPNPEGPAAGWDGSLADGSAALAAAARLPPVPVTPDPSPGGFVPYEPAGPAAPAARPAPPAPPVPLYGDSVADLTPDQISKAQKYCKWASSALNYDDVKTAIANLKNALELLQTGIDPA